MYEQTIVSPGRDGSLVDACSGCGLKLSYATTEPVEAEPVDRTMK